MARRQLLLPPLLLLLLLLSQLLPLLPLLLLLPPLITSLLLLLLLLRLLRLLLLLLLLCQPLARQAGCVSKLPAARAMSMERTPNIHTRPGRTDWAFLLSVGRLCPRLNYVEKQ